MAKDKDLIRASNSKDNDYDGWWNKVQIDNH